MKKKSLIFGGAGFIGSHLAEELLLNDFEVTIFDKINCNKDNINHLLSSVKLIEGDFINEIEVKESLSNIDYVYHLVSTTLPQNSNLNPAYDVESNVISSLKLLDACVKASNKKIIFISSGGTVYGIPEKLPINESHPTNPKCSYGISKIAIEKYIQLYNYLYNLDYCVIRLSNPYGERQNPNVAQGVISVFLKKILLNEEIEIWGDGTVVRDFIYIKDAVKAMVSVLNTGSQYKIFNLGSGIGSSLNEILSIMEEVTSIKPKVNYTYKQRSIDIPKNILDNSLIRNELSWRPEVDINRGIALTWEWMKSHF